MIREATMLVGGLCFAALSLIPDSGASESAPVEKPEPAVAAATEADVDADTDEEEYGDPGDAWSYEDDETNFTFGEPMAMGGDEYEGEGMQGSPESDPPPEKSANPEAKARPSQQHAHPAPMS